jgi:hypothetical protein
MKLEYDTEADAAYVRLRVAAVTSTEEIARGVFMDVAADGRPVGTHEVAGLVGGVGQAQTPHVLALTIVEHNRQTAGVIDVAIGLRHAEPGDIHLLGYTIAVAIVGVRRVGNAGHGGAGQAIGLIVREEVGAASEKIAVVVDVVGRLARGNAIGSVVGVGRWTAAWHWAEPIAERIVGVATGARSTGVSQSVRAVVGVAADDLVRLSPVSYSAQRTTSTGWSSRSHRPSTARCQRVARLIKSRLPTPGRW